MVNRKTNKRFHRKMKKQFFLSSLGIGTKVSLFIFLMSFMTAMTISVTYYVRTNAVIVQKEIDRLAHNARLLAPRFTSLYKIVNDDDIVLSRMPPVQGIIRASQNAGIDPVDGSSLDVWKERLAEIFTTILELRPHYMQIRYIGVAEGGKELVRVDRREDKILRIPERDLQSKEKEPYFGNTVKLKTGETYLSDITLNREYGKISQPPTPTLRIATPIYTPDGSVFGIVIINVSYNEFLTALKNQISAAENLYITNTAGNYLLHPDRSRQFEFEGGKKSYIYEDFPELRKVLFSEKKGHSSFSEKSNEFVHFFKFTFDKNDSSRYLGVALTAPKKILLQESVAVRNQSFLIALILTALVSAFAIALSKNLTTPLNEIISAIRQYAAGQKHLSLQINRTDELGELSLAFAVLAENLEQETKNSLYHLRLVKKSEMEMKAVLDTVIDSIITINSRGIIQSFNPASERIFGYKAGEVIGQNVKMLMPEKYSRDHDQYILNYLRTGKKRIIGIGREVQAQHKDRRIFPIELGVSAVTLGEHQEDTDSTIFVGIIRDITERRATHEKLEEYTRQLETAKIEADTANYMKSMFLATMSHEIRTPMNGVIGMTELLLGTELNKRQRDYATTVINSAESLLTIINDILDFSKIESGKMELDPVSFNLMRVIDEVADLMMPRVKEKTIELVTRYAPGTPRYLVGDPVRIRQIILNLAGNAAKFTEKGSILIAVEEIPVLHLPEGHRQLKISVKDTGIGISPESQKRIFEKFSQADVSTTRKYGGTGLGLAICRELAHLMGGEIYLESESEKGSTFWFTVVLPEAEKPPEAVDVNVAGLKGLRALIVDDLSLNQKILEERLNNMGLHCEACANGDDALEKLHKAVKEGKPYQIAFLDHLMPYMNGDELARVIKNDSALSNTALVLLSSAGGGSYTKRLREAGFSAILTKPLHDDDLEKILALMWKQYQEGTSSIVTVEQLNEDGNPDPENLRFSGIHILLAEDNRTNQRFAIQILEDAGCRVTLAKNGREALEKAQENPPDIIFMDCEMPEVDGYQATQLLSEMKSDVLIPDIPIIALTADTMDNDRRKRKKAGMCDYLSKPMRKKDLLAMVRKWLPDQLEEAPSKETAHFEGYKALLVEDNRTNRIMAEEILEDMGFIVDIAENGQIACEKVRKDSYDIVLMDMQMPVMDGYEATKAIRALIADGALKDMPIIALTANAMKGDREKCLEAGTNDYIGKPFRKAVLNSTIARWLEPKNGSKST